MGNAVVWRSVLRWRTASDWLSVASARDARFDPYGAMAGPHGRALGPRRFGPRLFGPGSGRLATESPVEQDGLGVLLLRLAVMNEAVPQLCLASSSPRRSELLTRAGIAFTVVPSTGDEEDAQGMPPVALALARARIKGRCCA